MNNFTKITDIALGPFTVQAWGTMVALGMLIGLWLTLKEAKRKKVDKETVLDTFFWMMLAAILGSRVLYVILFWRDFVDSPLDAFKIWEGGLVLLGGVLSAIGVLWFMCRKKGIPMLKMTDTMAPGLAAGICCGRIGCYLIGDHIGSPMEGDFFWGSIYSGTPDVLRHEPSLYLAINGFALFLFLWFMRKRVKKQGNLTMLFFVWYGAARFLLDVFRNTDLPNGLADPRFASFTISQYVSLLLFLLGAYSLIRSRWSSPKKS